VLIYQSGYVIGFLETIFNEHDVIHTNEKRSSRGINMFQKRKWSTT